MDDPTDKKKQKLFKLFSAWETDNKNKNFKLLFLLGTCHFVTQNENFFFLMKTNENLFVQIKDISLAVKNHRIVGLPSFVKTWLIFFTNG